MKKLFLMLAMMLPIFAFVACSDDDEDNPMVGSYQITNTVEKYSNGVVDVLNGTMYDCVVIEYDENKEVIKQDYVGSIAYGGGVSQIIETDPLCKSIIVTFFYLPNDGEYEAINERMAVAQFFEIPVRRGHAAYEQDDRGDQKHDARGDQTLFPAFHFLFHVSSPPFSFCRGYTAPSRQTVFRKG